MIKPHEAQKLTESEVSAVERCEALVDAALRREFTGGAVRVQLGPMSARERTALGARCEGAGWRYTFHDEPDGPCGQFTQLVLELAPATYVTGAGGALAARS